MTVMTRTEISPTERKVAEMLLEDTGSSFLDSGGAYGRAWQQARAHYLGQVVRNSAYSGTPLGPIPPVVEDDVEVAAAMMLDEPSALIDSYGSLMINAFHFLVKTLDYDAALDAKYQRFTRVHNYGKDKWDAEWGLPVVTAFTDQLARHGRVGSMYDSDSGPLSDNSYNSECSLSRTIQFTQFSVDNDYGTGFLPDGSYVLLQIHGGADVRGGYTDPVLFGCDFESFYSWNDAGLSCTPHPVVRDGQIEGQIEGQIDMHGEVLAAKDVCHRWYTDDGRNWYANDAEGDLRFDEYDLGSRLLAVMDEETGFWMCPIDGTKLEVYA